MVIGANLTAIAREWQHVERASVLAERSAGNDQRGMPVQDAPLFDAGRQRRIGEIDPVDAAKLYRVTVGGLARLELGVWHPRMSSPPSFSLPPHTPPPAPPATSPMHGHAQ